MQLVRIVWHYSYINVNRWKKGRKFQNFKRNEKNPHLLSFYSFGQCLLNGGFKILNLLIWKSMLKLIQLIYLSVKNGLVVKK
jgi:hypothetical protein